MTVGGLPGTGTSTLCRLLERAIGLPYVYAGQMFREEAALRGHSLQDYNELAQRDPSVDRSLDDRQLELLRGGGVILEGRMAGWLADHHTIPAFKVWVVCDEDERARRLAARDGGDPAVQRRMTRIRVAREQDRYLRYYGADLSDTSFYDLVLDSTATPAEAIVERVLAALNDP